MSEKKLTGCSTGCGKTGCIGAKEIDKFTADVVVGKKEVSVVVILEEPCYAFTIGMRTICGKPDLFFSLNTNPSTIGAILGMITDHIENTDCDLSKVQTVGSVLPVKNPKKKTRSDPDSVMAPVIVVPIKDNLKEVQKMMGSAVRFYGDSNFSVCQVFIPDQNLLFPWQEGCDEEFVAATSNLCDSKELHIAAGL